MMISPQGCTTCRRTLRVTLLATLVLLLLAVSPPALVADITETFQTPRFILHINHETSEDAQKIPADELQRVAFEVLNDTFDELNRILGTAPRNQVVLRFLSPGRFRERTGAPHWTNAMYYRGEIILPISEKNTSRHAVNLKKALRHEYVHALIADVSTSRCPAWLDEGLAQLIEGEPNPTLGPALRRWIEKQPAMPLAWLEDGFLTLQNDLVPAAYAQSLFATRTLVNTHGFPAIRTYLRLLGDGLTDEDAFSRAFGRRKADFEAGLSDQILAWSRSTQPSP